MDIIRHDIPPKYILIKGANQRLTLEPVQGVLRLQNNFAVLALVYAGLVPLEVIDGATIHVPIW